MNLSEPSEFAVKIGVSDIHVLSGLPPLIRIGGAPLDRWFRHFRSSLYELHQNGQISLEDALRNATSENNLHLRIQFDGTAAKDR